MNRIELLKLVKDLNWHVERGELRCERGDCPIIAAYKKTFPGKVYLDDYYGDLIPVSNQRYAQAAQEMGLNIIEARNIAGMADNDGMKLLEEINKA